MNNKGKIVVESTAKKKKDPFKDDVIWGPLGQLAYPGEVTRIPSSNISMSKIPYPVHGIDNNGNYQYMLPGGSYNFPNANYVDEYPVIKKSGGQIYDRLGKRHSIKSYVPFAQNGGSNKNNMKKKAKMFPQIQSMDQFFSPMYHDVPAPYRNGSFELGGYTGFGEGHPFPYQPRMPKNGAEAYGMPTGPNWYAADGGENKKRKKGKETSVPIPQTGANYRFPQIPETYGQNYRGYEQQVWPPQYSTLSDTAIVPSIYEAGPNGPMLVPPRQMGGAPCYNCGGSKKKSGGQADINQGPEYFTNKQNNFHEWLRNTALSATEQEMTNQFKQMGGTGYTEQFPLANPYSYGAEYGLPEAKKGGSKNWIQGAVNPKHKGFCTPMTKATCTPRRKAFAMTMKKHHGFHKQDGGEQDQVAQLIQAYAQKTGADPDQLMSKLQEMDPEQQQQALQQISQEVGGDEQEQSNQQEEYPDYMQTGGGADTAQERSSYTPPSMTNPFNPRFPYNTSQSVIANYPNTKGWAKPQDPNMVASGMYINPATGQPEMYKPVIAPQKFQIDSPDVQKKVAENKAKSTQGTGFSVYKHQTGGPASGMTQKDFQQWMDEYYNTHPNNIPQDHTQGQTYYNNSQTQPSYGGGYGYFPANSQPFIKNKVKNYYNGSGPGSTNFSNLDSNAPVGFQGSTDWGKFHANVGRGFLGLGPNRLRSIDYEFGTGQSTLPESAHNQEDPSLGAFNMISTDNYRPGKYRGGKWATQPSEMKQVGRTPEGTGFTGVPEHSNFMNRLVDKFRGSKPLTKMMRQYGGAQYIDPSLAFNPNDYAGNDPENLPGYTPPSISNDTAVRAIEGDPNDQINNIGFHTKGKMKFGNRMNGEDMANWDIAGMQGLTGILNANDTRKKQKQLNKRFKPENWMATNYNRDRGDYTSNQGYFRPNDQSVGNMITGKFGGSYEVGGEYDMTDEELQQFLKNGGTVDYI